MAPSLLYEQLEDDFSSVLTKDFTSEYRKGYISVGGHILPEYYREFGDRILNFDVREDDIWLCSFPKCGTTWAQEMVWCIMNDLNFEKAKVPLPERFPFLEHTALFDYRNFKLPDDGFRFPDYVVDSVGYLDKLRENRFIKTHLAYNLLPEQIQNKTVKPKVIYVSRDARDCCVSYYHHSRLLEGYKGDFKQFIELFMAGKVCFGPFWKHVLNFWQHRNDENFLFIRFEDMKFDLKATIGRVADFLGKSLSREQIDDLSDHLSFESMKKNNSVNYEIVKEINVKLGLNDCNGNFMRSGKVGDYKSHMTKEEIKTFDEWCTQNLTTSDYNENSFQIL